MFDDAVACVDDGVTCAQHAAADDAMTCSARVCFRAWVSGSHRKVPNYWPILESLADMHPRHGLLVVEVGNGACDAHNAMVRSC